MIAVEEINLDGVKLHKVRRKRKSDPRFQLSTSVVRRLAYELVTMGVEPARVMKIVDKVGDGSAVVGNILRERKRAAERAAVKDEPTPSRVLNQTRHGGVERARREALAKRVSAVLSDVQLQAAIVAKRKPEQDRVAASIARGEPPAVGSDPFPHSAEGARRARAMRAADEAHREKLRLAQQALNGSEPEPSS